MANKAGIPVFRLVGLACGICLVSATYFSRPMRRVFVAEWSRAFDLPEPERQMLLQEHLDAGQHEIAWDGKDASGRSMASGVYFARLSAGGGSETRRMVMLK